MHQGKINWANSSLGLGKPALLNALQYYTQGGKGSPFAPSGRSETPTNPRGTMGIHGLMNIINDEAPGAVKEAVRQFL